MHAGTAVLVTGRDGVAKRAQRRNSSRLVGFLTDQCKLYDRDPSNAARIQLRCKMSGYSKTSNIESEVTYKWRRRTSS
jgi:hypothetical protein